MAMGSTGTVNVAPEMLTNALGIIEEYKTATTNLKNGLDGTMNNLKGSFSGSAADGFQFFYTDKIAPVIGDGLTQLLEALRQISQGILDAIPGDPGVDEVLATENKK